MSNALAQERSPYLRQHQDNPVDWLPWGDLALQRARELDRPLLVSIGYSACHWCHVMERESFEDSATAALMNEHFVCVKVDREERPDIDAIYMEAVQAMTGHGGWPLNVFLTPQQLPFYGGTYFPPRPRHGMPSWTQVLSSLAQTWRERREDVQNAGATLAQHLGASASLEPSAVPLGGDTLMQAQQTLNDSYDYVGGGWGAAPKFPSASAIEFLLRRGDTRAPLHALRAMAAGGVNDQVGGGFSRYSVDEHWQVPHFEKMLYDNALLARAYLHGWQVSGDELLLHTTRETLDFCLRELRAPVGGFYCALDADSDGVEGSFYIWTTAQLEEALGELAPAAIAYFGATARGNFEGSNVLQAHGPRPPQRETIRAQLLQARARRVRPALDYKCLTAWNALMISALADAGATLNDATYINAAIAAADFVLSELRDEHGRLLRTWVDGVASLDAYLEDHAFLLEALLTLYEACFEERFYIEALALAEELLARFSDPQRGGFFATASDHEALITRRKELDDAPIPAGSSSAAFGLLRLASLSGDTRYEEGAVGALRLAHEYAARRPSGFGHLLCALDFHLGPQRELALIGPEIEEFRAVVRAHLQPYLVVAAQRDPSTPSAVPLLAQRPLVNGLSAAYLCERFSCQQPITEAIRLETALQT